MFPKVRGGLLSVPLEAHPDVPPPSSIAAEPSGLMEDRPSAPQVLLYRPILQGGPPLNEALRVRRIGLCFFFSFELSYLRAPQNPDWPEPRRLALSCRKNLLLSALSLCRMVLRGLE